MENCIRQNNAIDIYEDYYGDLSVDRSSDAPAAKTINIFRSCCDSVPRCIDSNSDVVIICHDVVSFLY